MLQNGEDPGRQRLPRIAGDGHIEQSGTQPGWLTYVDRTGHHGVDDPANRTVGGDRIHLGANPTTAQTSLARLPDRLRAVSNSVSGWQPSSRTCGTSGAA